MNFQAPISDVHPLSPLSADEIQRTAAIVRRDLENGADALFETIELAEPDRTSVRNRQPNAALDRRAWANVYFRARNGVVRCLVSLSEDKVVSQDHRKDAQPMISAAEFMGIENAIKADPRFIAACNRRGIKDLTHVTCDPWSAGNFGIEEEKGRRISHVFCWIRNSAFDNHYAHPIEGLNATVDISTLEVLTVTDKGDVPIPSGEANYDRTFQTEVRDDLRAIDVVQPEGVSFQLSGHRLTWADWNIRIGFNPREGLTLHDISIGGRPVLYRASIAEMMVPYGSPEGAHPRKNVFDIGEYGIGRLCNSLELGCDCLGSIQYLDAEINTLDGEVETIKNAICIHEEDTGILWKHWDFRLNRTEVRRARRLVVSTIATVGNYEYGYYWYFYLDGEIEFEMKATGIINTVGCVPGEGSRYGTEVSPGVVGQIHQHVFCARLDMSIDGERNAIVECDTVAETPGPDNPYGNAFYVQETELETEGGRKRNADAQRFWKFESRERTNFMGKPTAYKLEPTQSVAAFHDPEGPSGKRMGFIYNQLWVTPFDGEERWPAGDFVNGNAGGEGLPTYVEQGRPVADTDVVAWHVFGLHHLPRLEDYPVQPCVRTGFKMMPSGFFDRNPNLDLATETNKASCNVIAAE